VNVVNKENKTRTPKQERSIKKKAVIREIALSLFCQEGYHKVTTNQIAKTAGMSVGSLYEYYKDKENILIDILNGYFEVFLNNQNSITQLFRNGIKNPDKHLWIRLLLDNLIKSHRSSLDFNRELHILYFSIPEVATICNTQKSILRTIVHESLLEIKDELIVKDVEAATIIFLDLLDSIIDRITLYPLQIDEEKIINEGIDAICRFLFGK
jgi:AcrR family transcriptional regulator